MEAALDWRALPSHRETMTGERPAFPFDAGIGHLGEAVIL
jgi:hypothetical protein